MAKQPGAPRWLRFLGPVLAVAFCAFFATVLGLVSAFQSVGNVDAAHKSQHLSEGIARAMSFTAFGLGLDALVLVLLIGTTLWLRRAPAR